LSSKVSPVEFYTSRLEYYTSKVQAVKGRLKQLAILRLGIFLATLIMIFIGTRWGFLAIGMIALAGFTGFILTLIRYLA